MKRGLTALLILALLAAPLTAASADSEEYAFDMTFVFDDRTADSVKVIDEALSGLLLSYVDIEDSKGYSITTTTTKDGVSTTTYGYGFDSVLLKCEKKGDELYTWHVGAEAYPRSVYRNSDEFKAAWDKEHPGNVIRTMITIEYSSSDLYAFVFLYHEKTPAGNPDQGVPDIPNGGKLGKDGF